MMDTSYPFIATTEEITPQSITNLLINSPALQAGIVTHVQVTQVLHAPMSNIACILTLNYYDDAQGKLPQTVFFKNGRMVGEVSFYQHVVPLLPHRSMVECYLAKFENELGQSNLVFEDIQHTHNLTNTEEALGEKGLTNAILTLASFHRTGWEHPELTPTGQIGGNVNDLPNNLALPRAKQLLESFFEAFGDELSTRYREHYIKIFNKLPHPVWQERKDKLKNVTIVHGDVHQSNIAMPLNNQDSIRLLDWSLWHIDLPTYDLTYLLALRTSPELRQKIEKRLLEEYHTALGIPQYSFEQLLNDYRLSILFQTIWPVFFHSFTQKSNWMPLHNNIMQAFDDWDCESLLD